MGSVPFNILAAVALASLSSMPAVAQTRVAGRVSGLDGLPVPGAVVDVVGRTHRVIAAPDGTFSIVLSLDSRGAGPTALRAGAPGRSPTVRLVPRGTGTHRVDLVLGPYAGPSMIHTGLAAPTPLELVPFTIGTVSAEALADVPATTLLGGLRGRVSGVRVNNQTGDPAVAPVIRVRGPDDFDGGSDPLIIVDGAVVRGSLADIPALDIERIEVAKGPAAAAFYGSEGAAGVIQVFTRRGGSLPAGRIHFTVRTEVGVSSVTSRLPGNRSHDFEITTGAGSAVDFVRDQSGNRVRKADRVSDNPYPRYFDHQGQVLSADLVHRAYLSVGGRHRSTGFMASLENLHSGSPINEMSGFQRRSLRLNLDQRFGALVDVSISGSRGWSDSDAFVENNILSPVYALRVLEPHLDLLAPNPDGSPYLNPLPDQAATFNPLYSLSTFGRENQQDRLTGGGIVRIHPVSGVEASLSHHIDREVGDSLLVPPAGPNSFTSERRSEVRSKTTEATVALSGRLGKLTGVTRFGYQYEERMRQDSTESLSQSPPGLGSWSSSRFNMENRSVYAVAALTLANRYVLDGAVRRERRLFLGFEAEPRWFYRVAGLWRASDDLGLGARNDLRFHAAYGTASTPPELSLGPILVLPPGQQPPTPVPPAGSAELEVGADLAVREGRFAVEYAYSRKTVRHLSSFEFVSGFLQLVDAGTVRSWSHELTLRSALIQNRSIRWDLNLTADRIRARILEYNIPQRLVGAGARVFLLREGETLGTMYGSRFVRAVAELSDDPAKQAQSGPGQAYDPANFVVNEEGYVVAKEAWRCGEDLRYRDTGLPCATPERPILYVSCFDPGCTSTRALQRIGDATPDFRVGIQSAVRYDRFRAAVVLDWSQGGDVYNASRHFLFSTGRDPVFDQRGKPEVEKKSTGYYAAFHNSLNPLDYFVESGTFVKVTELALTYSFGPNQLRRMGLGGFSDVSIGLVGRNLLTLTGYSGNSPDLASQVDFFQYPQFRTVTGKIEVSF